MKIHKTTETNVSACGMPTVGLILSVNWHDVDCVRCLKSELGEAERAIRVPSVVETETDRDQLELEL